MNFDYAPALRSSFNHEDVDFWTQVKESVNHMNQIVKEATEDNPICPTPGCGASTTRSDYDPRIIYLCIKCSTKRQQESEIRAANSVWEVEKIKLDYADKDVHNLVVRDPPKEIFVFGSNLAGRHGMGSAAEAVRNHGAQYGVGFGRTGRAYAIPTKDEKLNVLPLQTIAIHVKYFIQYAKLNDDYTFNIVAIGCGLAGYKPSEVAPMFKSAPSNCKLPKEFEVLLLNDREDNSF